MGEVVFVAGRSGSGKSYSLRNFAPDEVGVYNVLGKRLPFRARLLSSDRPGYAGIMESLARNTFRAYVVDDSTYLMQLENFSRSDESGYQKYTDMAKNFEQLIMAAKATDDDTVTYFLHHVEDDGLGGEKLKTVGKMLDERFCIEGTCSVFIDCIVDADGRHRFSTRPGPRSLAKAPPGMLPEDMDNDLKAVDDAIRDYWGLAPAKREAAPEQTGQEQRKEEVQNAPQA